MYTHILIITYTLRMLRFVHAVELQHKLLLQPISRYRNLQV